MPALKMPLTGLALSPGGQEEREGVPSVLGQVQNVVICVVQ